jgi:Glycosyl transferase family 2
MTKRPRAKTVWTDLAQQGGPHGRCDCQAGWHVFFGQSFHNKTILDVGAALGRSRARLAVNGNRVTLQDPAPGLSVDIRKPVEAIPDKSYDVVTAFDVIEHVVEDEAFLAQLVRIAREQVVLTTPNYNHSRAANPCHCREYTPKQFLHLLRKYDVEMLFAGTGRGHKIALATTDPNVFGRHDCQSHAVKIRVGRAAPRPFSFTVLLPTIGRPTLERTLQSIKDQKLLKGDEVLLVSDGHYPGLAERWQASGLPGRFLELPGPHGDWGHTPRNLTLPGAGGDYILSIDDDDIYVPGAFRTIRACLRAAPERPHLFRFCMRRLGGAVYWKVPVIRFGSVGTPCLVYPNRPGKFGTWAPYRGGDYVFIQGTCAHYAEGPVWHEEVIVVARPESIC